VTPTAHPVELVWYGDDAPRYDHGPGHPLRFERVALTRRLIHAAGLVGGAGAAEVPARSATDAELELVHEAAYLEAVRRAGRGEAGPWARYGFGPGDNPVFPAMHEAAARVAGASVVAAEAVWSGRARHAFNPAGGLHHAMAARASGFCVYDDPAVAIAWLLAQGAGKVAYVDVDVHHGDGPQALFYGDPRVLTVSLHQDGRTLFPGTGAVGELGAGAALGTAVNVPLPPGTGDEGWLAAFGEIVAPVVRAFSPAVLVTQLGCDTHHRDPLASLALTTAAYRETARRLHALAHEAAGGRWVATGGGGYRWASVVPRAWAVYFAEMAGAPLADELPAAWVAEASEAAGHPVPATISEAAVAGGGAAAVTPVVEAVRAAVFPRWGLA